MSNQSKLYFTQILSSRICHDLVSPIGAIRSGLELLEDSAIESENREVFDLLTKSASVAEKRLGLYRLAFGYGASVHSLFQLQETLEDVVESEKFQIQCQFPDQMLAGHPDLKAWVKLATNLVLICMEAAPYGGKIELTTSSDKEINLEVSLEASPITFSNEVKQAFTDHEPEELTPRTVQVQMTAMLADQLNRSIAFQEDGQRLVLSTKTSDQSSVTSPTAAQA